VLKVLDVKWHSGAMLKAIGWFAVRRWFERSVLLSALYAIFQFNLNLLVQEDPLRSALGRDAGASLLA
jgi:hypothetical protein